MARRVATVVWASALALVAGCGGQANPVAPSGQGGQSASDAAVSDLGAAGGDGAPGACVDPSTGLPEDVFCTGLYDGRDPTRHVSSAMPYQPGVVLWSDGAEKQRYLYLPPSTKIDTSNMDAWKFPVGTKAWKEFRLGGVLVETRLFWKRSETMWESGTYIWDSTGKAAPLNTDRMPVLRPDGYEIPTAKDCGKCHHGGADKLLGIEAVAMALPTASGVTLKKLVDGGYLSQPPPTTSLTLPEDATGKAGVALGYLHANCGMPCHSARGLGEETQLVLRLRADEFWPVVGSGGDAGATTVPATAATTDTYLATVNKDPTTASVAQQFPGAFRITPGAHDKSLIWLLAHRRGNYQMPPLVSHRVDDTGTQLLADWIDALTK